jgi:2-desacetyl-2-hydroxyethyl bacteriochlorophyllide A dehydrogenase
MRQILLREPGDFVDRQVPRPLASHGDALVGIRRVGVCGSDFHAFAGRHPAYTFPRVLGHELAGEIVEVPAGEHGIRVGDRCAIEPYVSCGTCRACKLGRTNCCQDLRLFGVHVDGGMQAFLSVPVPLLHKSEILTLDQLALIETLGVGAHAVRRSGLTKLEEALVIGAGPIGLAVTQFAQATGAVVRIVEKNPWRRDFAGRFGVKALEEADGHLADVVFDATGNPKSMEASLQFVAPAGRLVFVGLCRDRVCIDDPLLHKREITLYASRNSCGQFPHIIRMIEQSQIDTAPWITDRMPLADVPARLKDLPGNPHLIKAVVEVEEIDA